MNSDSPMTSDHALSDRALSDRALTGDNPAESDLQIAGDILSVPHLLRPAPEHPATVAEFAGLARSIAADRTQWEHLVAYDATSRWYHRLRAVPQALGSARAGEPTPGYEVWILSWVPGQGSGLHDHGRSAGVLTVLQGRLTEHSERGTRTLSAGTVGASPLERSREWGRVFPPGYVHEIVNDSLEPAVSLHVYFPGLSEMPMHHARCAPVSHDATTA
jgi:hypothetical protein